MWRSSLHLNSERKSGYSLIETIVAGMIFASVAVALAGVFNYHYRAVNSSRLFLVAQHLAKTEADQMLAAGFDKIQESVINPNPSTRTANVTWTIRDQRITTEFTLETSFTDDGVAGHRVCVVRVNWEEGGRTRHVQYNVSVSPES